MVRFERGGFFLKVNWLRILFLMYWCMKVCFIFVKGVGFLLN